MPEFLTPEEMDAYMRGDPNTFAAATWFECAAIVEAVAEINIIPCEIEQEWVIRARKLRGKGE